MREMRKGNRNVRGLRELMALVPGHSRMAEVGSFAGESARVFVESGKLDVIFCVDHWVYYPGKDYAEAEMVFDEMASCYPQVVKKKLSSQQAAREMNDASLDIVYIDANHKYDCIKEDIELWLPKVKPGGILSGHDFSHRNLGVIQAVSEKFGKPEHVFCDGSWMVYV